MPSPTFLRCSTDPPSPAELSPTSISFRAQWDNSTAPSVHSDSSSPPASLTSLELADTLLLQSQSTQKLNDGVSKLVSSINHLAQFLEAEMGPVQGLENDDPMATAAPKSQTEEVRNTRSEHYHFVANFLSRRLVHYEIEYGITEKEMHGLLSEELRKREDVKISENGVPCKASPSATDAHTPVVSEDSSEREMAGNDTGKLGPVCVLHNATPSEMIAAKFIVNIYRFTHTIFRWVIDMVWCTEGNLADGYGRLWSNLSLMLVLSVVLFFIALGADTCSTYEPLFEH